MGEGIGSPRIAKRAAVAVGVNRTVDLTPLRAAVAGARDVAHWLGEEGYRVTCLDDEGGPVTVGMVKDAVRSFLDLRTLDQIVIYFAGHGYLTGTSEIWLLSGAPADPDEAVDLSFSAELARSCGVRSVVFISDACRSNPPTLIAARVQGSSIFPNRPAGAVDVEVDRFFAARPGDPALELEVGEARSTYAGLFTEMLRGVHRDPDRELVLSLRSAGEELAVLPSRRLKDILPVRVDEAAQERSIRLRQIPQLRLECGEKAYIARAIFTPSPGASTGQSEVPATDAQAMAAAKRRYRPRVAQPRWHDSPAAAGLVGSEPDASARIARIRMADRAVRLEMMTGVRVTGAGIVDVFCPGFTVIPETGDRSRGDASEAVRVEAAGSPFEAPSRPSSLLVRFDDGGGTVLALLPGYVASVLVEEGRVVSVTWSPSENSNRWAEYDGSREHVEDLRARAAVAARSGLLAVGRDGARAFGERIGRLKWFDPSLGLYAAVAYAEAGLGDRVASIRALMLRKIGADLFDVAALSAASEGAEVFDMPPVAPFCPMLGQTWSFIRSRGVKLHPLLDEALVDRRPALWTTFNPAAVDLLRDAMKKGDL